MQGNVTNQVVELYVDDIIPNRFQPREVFDDKGLQELAQSIKEHGVIQPIIVRQINDKYEIIAGERRYKANIMAGFTKIPAIIRNLDDKETAKVALLENLQRKNLSPIEEARTYQKILDLDSMTQEELGKTMGKSQASIANKLRLLQLSDEVQEALIQNQISERHARSLLSVQNKELQVSLLNKVINNKMTVRDLDQEIQSLGFSVQDAIPDRNINAGQAIDLAQLKNNTTDINGAVTQSNDINSLLSGTRTEAPINNGPSLDFLNQFDNTVKQAPNVPQVNNSIADDNITNIVSNNNWATPSGNQELPIPDIIGSHEEVDNNLTIKDAINSVRDLAKVLEEGNVKVDLSEMDLEKYYQITIKFEKEEQ